MGGLLHLVQRGGAWVGLPTQDPPPLLLVEEKSRRLCSCWKHPHSTLAVARCCLVPPCFDKSLSASVYLLSALFLTHTYTAATGSNVWVCRSSACALRFVLQSVASRDSETFPLVMSEEWWVRRWEKLACHSTRNRSFHRRVFSDNRFYCYTDNQTTERSKKVSPWWIINKSYLKGIKFECPTDIKYSVN